MFGPGDAVTREQFAKMAVGALNLTSDTTGGPHFPDVGSDRWSYSFVETLYNWSVVDGYPDGSFKPGNDINRAEIAKMVVGAMNPVKRGTNGAFNVESASAASATSVDVMFSMAVDPTTGAVPGNFMIKDASGNALAVTAATVSADTVTLTTGSQTANTPYALTVTGVTAVGGKTLDQGTASFNGYNPLGVGGPLTVALDANTPKSMSVPKGATGVVFTCWDFTAGSAPVVVQSLTVHRTGAGSQTDFNNVYLYNDAARLTTGRSINSSSQTVEFNNVNVDIASGGMAKLCLVGDFTTLAAGAAQHAFELTAATSVTTNASSVGGTFPLTGNLMTVAGGTVGKVTVTVNGALDQITVGQSQARIAQFQLETDGSEDQSLQRVALYVRGSVRTTDLSNFNLYKATGGAPIATTPSVGPNGLVTFVLATPDVVQRGQREIYYVTADVKGRNADTVKVYLDQPSDLLMVGNTFGFGVQVDDGNNGGVGKYNGSNVDGIDGTADDFFSYTTIKGSTFTIAFNGPTAGDMAVGQKAAHCLDLTLTNASGGDVDIRNWVVNIKEAGAVTAAGGLIDTSGSTPVPNYTLIRLAQINADGTVGGSILGPNELIADTSVNTGNDIAQSPTLSGDYTIAGGSSLKVAVLVDISSQAALNGDKITCTLNNPLASGSDTIRDSNGDQLTAADVTPSTNITGNQMSLSASALTFSVASTPTSRTYVRGAMNVPLLGLTVRSGSSLDNTIKSLNLQGYVGGSPAVTPLGTASENVSDGPTNLKDEVSSLGLYMNGTLVSDLKNVDSTSGKVLFNNVTIPVAKNSAPYGALNDLVKFAVASSTDVIAIDGNGQTVATGSISTVGANNNLAVNAAPQTIMTISAGGVGTVANSSGAESKAKLLVGMTDQIVGRWTFSSTNDNANLRNMVFGSFAPNSISRVTFKNASTGTTVGDPTGYPVESNGTVIVKDMNLTIPDSTPVTIEGHAMTNVVAPGGANSGDKVGLVLLSVDEVDSSSGVNVAAQYVGTPVANTVLNGAGLPGGVARYSVTGIAPSVTVSNTAAGATGAGATVWPANGSVVIIDQEQMVVLAGGGSATATLMRGVTVFPPSNTTASHAAGAQLYLSSLASIGAAASPAASTLAATDPAAGTAPSTYGAGPVPATDTNITVAASGVYTVGGGIIFVNSGTCAAPGANSEAATVTSIVDATHITVNRGTNGSVASTHIVASGICRATSFPISAIAPAITVSSVANYKVGDVLLLTDSAATGDGLAPEYVLVTGITGTTLSVFRGMYGTTPAAHAQLTLIARFTDHGDVSVLRKTAPALSQDTLPQTIGALPNSATPVLRFTVAATGADRVIFDAGNSITVHLSGKPAGSSAGPYTCQLRDPANPSVVFADKADWTGGAGLVAATPFNYTVVFNNFNAAANIAGNAPTSSLIINAGSSQKLEVNCDTTGMGSAGATTSSMNASILNTTGNFIYDDGVAADNVSGDEVLIPGLPINGPTLSST